MMIIPGVPLMLTLMILLFDDSLLSIGRGKFSCYGPVCSKIMFHTSVGIKASIDRMAIVLRQNNQRVEVGSILVVQADVT